MVRLMAAMLECYRDPEEGKGLLGDESWKSGRVWRAQWHRGGSEMVATMAMVMKEKRRE